MAKIILLGAGVMGSAFAQLLADTNNEVCLVGTHLDQDIIDSVMNDGTHPKLKVKLPACLPRRWRKFAILFIFSVVKLAVYTAWPVLVIFTSHVRQAETAVWASCWAVD